MVTNNIYISAKSDKIIREFARDFVITKKDAALKKNGMKKDNPINRDRFFFFSNAKADKEIKKEKHMVIRKLS